MRLRSALQSALVCALMGLSLPAPPALAAISPSQVLVVYNSAAPDSAAVLSAYLAAHPDIPAGAGQNVFDLNDPSIAGVPTISYADFVAKIRNPIRNYLDAAGGPSASSIVSIVLIRGIPHRIQDTDNANVGDTPSAMSTELSNGDATCAAVDSELTLLWQNLNSGESGGQMDSHADNLIDNPYHTSSQGIGGFSRTSIKIQKTLNNLGNAAWQSTSSGPTSGKLTPGDMYLVCRIDGTTAAAAQAVIQRGANAVVNRRYAWIILDEDARANHLDDDDLFPPPTVVFNAGPDYEDTRDVMQAAGWNVRYDSTATFITSTLHPQPVIAYASYGHNHSPAPSGAGTYIDNFAFPPGAIFNTIESYNGRALNGLGTLFNQEQVADFITVGGTFAIGNVWEPFSFGLPDNEFLCRNLLLNGMTWGEAAWSAIPALSWMQVVIGDPLATVTVIDQPGDFTADGQIDDADVGFLIDCTTGSQLGPPAPGCGDADLDGDGDVDGDDFGALQRCYAGPGVILDPPCYLP